MFEQDVVPQVMQMRSQGLPDNLIISELGKQGIPPEQVQGAIAQADSGASFPPVQSSYDGMSAPAPDYAGRMEEIAEGIIDQKWNDLLKEVQKVVDWKNRVEEQQKQLQNDVQKLKEDFRTLHQGVLGKLEDYDGRMREVGTELAAVGKVFKDTIPEFVENVKTFSHLVKKK